MPAPVHVASLEEKKSDAQMRLDAKKRKLEELEAEKAALEIDVQIAAAEEALMKQKEARKGEMNGEGSVDHGALMAMAFEAGRQAQHPQQAPQQAPAGHSCR